MSLLVARLTRRLLRPWPALTALVAFATAFSLVCAAFTHALATMLRSGRNTTMAVLAVKNGWDAAHKANVCDTAASFYLIAAVSLFVLYIIQSRMIPRIITRLRQEERARQRQERRARLRQQRQRWAAQLAAEEPWGSGDGAGFGEASGHAATHAPLRQRSALSGDYCYYGSTSLHSDEARLSSSSHAALSGGDGGGGGRDSQGIASANSPLYTSPAQFPAPPLLSHHHRSSGGSGRVARGGPPATNSFSARNSNYGGGGNHHASPSLEAGRTTTTTTTATASTGSASGRVHASGRQRQRHRARLGPRAGPGELFDYYTDDLVARASELLAPHAGLGQIPWYDDEGNEEEEGPLLTGEDDADRAAAAVAAAADDEEEEGEEGTDEGADEYDDYD